MLKVLIVDDEPIARTRLRFLCAERPELEVVDEAATGEQALAKLAGEIDLVLLDIAMPDGDGLSVARALASKETPPAVVFCTAYPNHALEAFEVSATDYLLKPVSRDRLARAVEKAARLKAAPRGSRASHPDWLDHLWAPYRDGMVRVDVVSILRIEAEGDYVRVGTATTSHLIHETMTRLESRLNPADFVRVRRSLIVRASEIERMRHVGDGVWEVTMLDGTSIRAGPTYWKALKARFRAGASGTCC